MSEIVGIPPVKVRNAHGLIENTLYQYAEDGFIDWRRMINEKHLTPNKQNFDRQQKPIPESIKEIEDKDLLILLSGIRELAWLRGFESVTYSSISSNPALIAVSCTIKWLPNFETEQRSITYSAIGDSTLENTNGFGKLFLGPIAENRAFVRCVRGFLRINILGQDEICAKSADAGQEISAPTLSALEQAMKDHNISFQTIINSLKKENYPDADKFTTPNDIPRVKQFDLIGRIKKRAAIQPD